MSKLLRFYLIVVAAALFGAFLTQTFMPAVGSAGTVWGLAPGWQREIGFWNVALTVIIVGVLVKGDSNSARIVALGVVVMGALFGTNHLFGYLSGQRALLGFYGEHGGTLWHAYGALVNYIGVVVGLLGLRAQGRLS